MECGWVGLVRFVQMARTGRELTDEQWKRLAPLLPPQRPKMGRPPKDHRTVVEGIVWILRTGAPWRDLPECFGKWQTVAGRFYDWRRAGVWERVLLGVQTEGDALGAVDGIHTYHVLAGTVPILVHNCGGWISISTR